MASAQILPSSRKQELAEAGRRKLEQFRKQKAAERAKKASSNSRIQAVDGKIGQQRVTESDGTVTSMSNGPVELFAENHCVSSNETHRKSPFSGDGYDSSSSNLAESDGGKQRSQKTDTSGDGAAVEFSSRLRTKDLPNESTLHGRPEGIPYNSIDKQASQNYDSDSSKSSFYGLENSVTSDGVPKVLPSLSGSTLLPSMSAQTESFGSNGGLTSSDEDSLQRTTKTTGSILEVLKNQQRSVEVKDSMEHKPSVSTSYLFSLQDNSTRPSESLGFDLETRSSSPLYPANNETNARKSRPSFLDSLNISRGSENKHQHSEVERGLTTSGGFQMNGSDGLGLDSLQDFSAKTASNRLLSETGASNSFNPFQNFRSSLFPLADGAPPGFPPPKQNEDFAALEQHIEDLTQEKFSLQRALEASRALAESLASENSSLTETYNQQRGIVNQLKDDMGRLQEQIQAHMVELESVRNECYNARLECNAADERAKILASEVISLEEKVLRLRSNELKLERELENAQAEMSSYKKKISSLEKDRQDLQLTINSLQEEKKILQTMLRKASSSGKSVDLGKSPTDRKDASTSTEGLAISDSIAESSHQSESNLSNDSSILPETGQLAFEGLSLSIPSDQRRMIENINTMISELAMEKEELVQALSSELSRSAKLKDLNNELSRKLEAQTQRLELLTAKNMASDNISSVKQLDSQVIQEITPFADEGDEVVERVLGWIMKLFPGGPSRRRTSKLL